MLNVSFGGEIEAQSHSPARENDAGLLHRRPDRLLIRLAVQRNTAIFTERMVEELTPTQFAALAQLYEVGPCSQNRLGRLTAMDAATIKGVIDRLTKREFTELRADSKDARLLMVHLTRKGRDTTKRAIEQGLRITAETLRPRSCTEETTLLKILRKLC